MPWLAAAVVGSAVVGGLMSSHAANNAADASERATTQSNALQREQYNQTRSDLSPFVQSGVTANNALQQRYGLAPANSNTAPTTSNALQMGQPGVVGGEAAAANYGDTGQPVRRPYGTGVDDGGFVQYDPANPGASVSAAPATYGAGATGAEPGLYGNTADPTYTPQSYTAPAPFSFTAADYKESPGFKFQMERGIDAINSSQAARGSMYSGATSKAIAQFAEGLALQDYNAAEGRARSYYDTDANRSRANYDADENRARGAYESDRGYLTGQTNFNTNVLQQMAGSGQSAAAGTGAAGQTYAANVGNALQTNAATQANAGLVAANNTNNLLGQGVNALAYGQRPGVVNNLASGGLVPPVNPLAGTSAGWSPLTSGGQLGGVR